MANPLQSPSLQSGGTASAQAQALLDQIRATHGLYLENISKIVDKIVKVHENGAAFYEKLILFDVGTIALSLTFLGQIVTHTPGAHVPRHPFIWYLCPAWFLLLISIYCCTHRIAGIHNLNLALVQQLRSWFSGEYINGMCAAINRMSGIVGGLPINSEQAQQLHFATAAPNQNLADVFSAMKDALNKALKEENKVINDTLQKASQGEKKTGIAARMAMLTTMIALVMICIFAIQSILQV